MTPLLVWDVSASDKRTVTVNVGGTAEGNPFVPVRDERFIFLGGHSMDITFRTDGGIFNYRVCALIIHNGKLLAMKNRKTPYYFLPGGRVKLHEEANNAILRELKEELGITAKIIRPLWLNQGFFTEDITADQFHELCIYYLIDISQTDLMNQGDTFVISEGNNSNNFYWLPIESLKDEYLYPLFIKEKIHELPEVFTILAEYE